MICSAPAHEKWPGNAELVSSFRGNAELVSSFHFKRASDMIRSVSAQKTARKC